LFFTSFLFRIHPRESPSFFFSSFVPGTVFLSASRFSSLFAPSRRAPFAPPLSFFVLHAPFPSSLPASLPWKRSSFPRRFFFQPPPSAFPKRDSETEFHEAGFSSDFTPILMHFSVTMVDPIRPSFFYSPPPIHCLFRSSTLDEDTPFCLPGFLQLPPPSFAHFVSFFRALDICPKLNGSFYLNLSLHPPTRRLGTWFPPLLVFPGNLLSSDISTKKVFNLRIVRQPLPPVSLFMQAFPFTLPVFSPSGLCGKEFIQVCVLI